MATAAPRFSVVVNTFDRLPFLRNTLTSLRRQRYADFEVVVVDGPSTDGTREFLETQPDVVVATIPERNLSRSRNTGIDAAAGDVVCFIDDDAVADPGWLEILAEAYARDVADAIGGFVYDHTGYFFQSRYLYCDRLGRVTHADEDLHPQYNFPHSFRFPYLMGTNATFRRAALREVGGFDEVFAWFHDESELCLRLNDAGFRVAVEPRAVVYHKYAPSHLRDAASVPKSFFVPARSTSYVVNRHGLPACGFAAVCDRLTDYHREHVHWARWHHEAGRIDATQRDRLIEDVSRGIDAGHEEARRWAHGRTAEIAPPPAVTRTFGRVLPPDGRPLHVCLLTTEYATRPPCGGIGKYLRELAVGLGALGHHVHVMMPGSEFTVDYVDGVFVHTVQWNAPSPESVPTLVLPPDHLRVSALLDREVERVHADHRVDAVVGTIWDSPGIVTMAKGRFPFVLTLQSTHKIIVAENERALDAPYLAHAAPKLIAAERVALERSPRIVSGSVYFAEHVQSLYDVPLDGRVTLIHHGMADRAANGRPPRQSGAPRRVLFVGRFEYRKGIDLLLAAIPTVLAAMPDRVEFDLVGADRPIERDGETFRGAFERRHPDHVRSGRVRFHGVVSDEARDRHYRDADVFVAPSRFESFGLIYVEAMMHSLPAVALACGAASEIFCDGIDGVLVRDESTTGLARALLELLGRTDDDLAALGRRARQGYESRFTQSRMVDAYVRELRARIDG